MRNLLRSLALLTFIPFVVVACAGAAAPPSPSPSSGPVGSTAQAVSRVVAANPQFVGIGPLNNDLIGQCCWYEAGEAPGGYRVTFHVGWGDCPSGCIEKHEWSYAVSANDGTIGLLSETGAVVPPGILPVGGGPGTGPTGIAGKAVAGPTCPVVRANDPSCDPRPVVGAVIVVKSLNGVEVARVQTDAAGAFQVGLPPGNYTVASDRTQGFPVPPAPVQVTVVANAQTAVQLQFDTGIR
jgi:hypothetical protein